MKGEVDDYTKVVLVQNLSYIVSEDDLHRMFDSCGKITNIRISVNHRGKSRGNAFIAFETHEMAIEALSKDEKRFFDRYIYVDLNKSSRIEEELTQVKRTTVFQPMLGKPYSENPLILKAYNILQKRKKKEEELSKQIENKVEETKKEEEKKEEINNENKKEDESQEKEKSNKKDSEHHPKKHKRSSRDRHHHHRHRRHRFQSSDSDEDSNGLKIYYSEFPEVI